MFSVGAGKRLVTALNIASNRVRSSVINLRSLFEGIEKHYYKPLALDASIRSKTCNLCRAKVPRPIRQAAAFLILRKDRPRLCG